MFLVCFRYLICGGDWENRKKIGTGKSLDGLEINKRRNKIEYGISLHIAHTAI